MFLLITKGLELYDHTFNELSDPRLKDRLLMGSPLYIVGIIAVYLMFVLKWGPKFMEKRKPFKFDRIIIVYNCIQIAICGYLVYMGITKIYILGRYSWICEPVDPSLEEFPMKVVFCCHVYFLTKVLDLLDTVFFVLRKKYNQVTFLHIYHHAGMVVLIWTGIKFYPGGHNVFTGFINSLVHVIMYSYYLITTINSEYKNNLWWKKYITQMQIVQFFLISLHWSAIVVGKACGFPRWPAAVMVPQNFFMVALFWDFYRKAYLRGNKVPHKLTNSVQTTGSVGNKTTVPKID